MPSYQILKEGNQTFNNYTAFIIPLFFLTSVHSLISCLFAYLLSFLPFHFFPVILFVSLNNLFLSYLGAGNKAPHSERKRGDAERKALERRVCA